MLGFFPHHRHQLALELHRPGRILRDDDVGAAADQRVRGALAGIGLLRRLERHAGVLVRPLHVRAVVDAGGLPPWVMAPSPFSFSFVSGFASEARTAAFNLSTTGAGVPAGATTPSPCVYCSKPGNPLSAIVRTAG